MRMFRKLSAVICTLQITSLLVSSAFGAVFKDVPQTYWAYAAIESVSAKGYLKDVWNEKFNPDSYIDKFTVSKILASAANYSQSDKDYSAENEIISKYSSKYSKWNSNSNGQIAYLLSKNILKEEDLESFMLFSDDGSEKFRGISKEELAVFFVRFMGKETTAEGFKDSNFFKDNENITEKRRGAVNYLKSINVLNGGSDGLCHPKNAVTKAEFCVLLNNVTDAVLKEASNPVQGSGVNNVSSISGVVEGYFKSIGIIQIKIDDEIKVFRINDSTKIKKDGESVEKDSILAGMNVSAIINNSEIIELSLSGESKNENEEKTESTTSGASDNSNASNNSGSEQLCTDLEASGTIYSIAIGSSVKDECKIGIMTEDGEVKYFSATRYSVPLYSLKVGDFAEVKAKDGQISTIKLKAQSKNVAVGYVSYIDDEGLTLETTSGEKEEFFYDQDLTECFDCTKGTKVDFDDISNYAEVYILYEDVSSHNIDVIFVLGNS